MPCIKKLTPLKHTLLAIGFATLAACQPKSPPMTPEEAQYIAQLTAHMTPRCVGHHVVDMPINLVWNSETSAEVEGVRLTVTPMTRPKFEMALAARKRYLETKLQVGETWPLLSKTYSLPESALGMIFDRVESESGGGRMGRTLELMAWRDGYQINAAIDARDTTFPEDANDSIAIQLRTNVSEKLAILLDVYSRVRGRPNDEMPIGAGLCIDYGFVKGPASEEEEVSLPFHLEGSPDLWFHFLNHPNMVKERETMLQRSGKIEREMKVSGTETIRKGGRELHGLPYEEWLMKGTTPDHVSGNLFGLVGNETKRGAEFPFIRLELLNGYRVPAPQLTADESAQQKALVKATLSEAQAIALWDKVTATLRLRPGAI